MNLDMQSSFTLQGKLFSDKNIASTSDVLRNLKGVINSPHKSQWFYAWPLQHFLSMFLKLDHFRRGY